LGENKIKNRKLGYIILFLVILFSCCTIPVLGYKSLIVNPTDPNTNYFDDPEPPALDMVFLIGALSFALLYFLFKFRKISKK